MLDCKLKSLENLFQTVDRKRAASFVRQEQNFNQIFSQLDSNFIEQTFLSYHSGKINKKREKQLSVLDDQLAKSLSSDSLSKVELLTLELKSNERAHADENVFSKFNLIGRLNYKNEFKMYKKVKYLDFYRTVRQIRTLNFKEMKLENGLKMINTLLIDLNTIFYHFKSKDHKSDLLIIATEKGSVIRQKLITFDSVYFTKYMLNNEYIVCQGNDFTTNTHQIKLYNMNLERLREIQFSTVCSLNIVNRKEMIVFVPYEYLVLDFDLNIVHKFGQYESIEKPFCFRLLNKIVHASSKNFSFLSSHQSILVLNRVSGKLMHRIQLYQNDEFILSENFCIIKNLMNNQLLYNDFRACESLTKEFEFNFSFFSFLCTKENEEVLYSVDEIAQCIKVF